MLYLIVIEVLEQLLSGQLLALPDQACKAAIAQFDGYTLDDRQLRVNEAQEKSASGGNRGGNRSYSRY